MTIDEMNALTEKVLGAAFEVHTQLGPGLLESVYEAALAWELRSRGVSVERQVPISVTYKGFDLEQEFRIDLLVEDRLVLELKSVERTTPVHAKQVLSYLKLGNFELGLLLNFGQARLKHGITRLVNSAAKGELASVGD